MATILGVGRSFPFRTTVYRLPLGRKRLLCPVDIGGLPEGITARARRLLPIFTKKDVSLSPLHQFAFIA
jgi:hypothetical protein